MFSRGGAKGAFHFMNSRIHCLAMMLKRAAARLMTRLKKNSPLIQRAREEGVKEGVARRDEIVEDITGGIPEWLPCDEVWYAMS